MKGYVRTKNRITDLSEYKEVREKEDRIDLWHSEIGEPAYWCRIDKDEIVGRGKSIDGLCDFWCYTYTCNGERQLEDCGYRSRKTIRQWLKEGRIKDAYLMIWTPKGLMYAAKMNEEWRLELL